LTDRVARCWFCGGESLEPIGGGHFHPIRHDFGPFDFLRCADCGSALTANPPSAEQLAALYAGFEDGLPESHRRITQDDPQTAWYARCADRIARLTGLGGEDEFHWIDVGAGGGELSALLGARFPHSRGTALDLHERPLALASSSRVEWLRSDVNGRFADGLQPADVVLSTAVWEHVLRPDQFAGELSELVSPGGLLYLVCPNYASIARRVLRTSWPYFTPGEHLNLPTPQGARRCLERAAPGCAAASRPMLLTYTVRYVLRRFGLERLGRLVPAAIGIPLPAGALETTMRRPSGVAAS
jgi:SAM-dependent methyltransferase